MRINTRTRGILFLAILFILMALPAAASEPKITETTLRNGLKVIIEEEHSSPVVAIQMWVKVGSADESESEAGLSHVFEHMLFKGTERRGVGELATEIESVGGDINAYTSFDNTVYHLTVPSRYFSTGLDVISDAIQNSAFDPDELSKELEVVLEEMRMNEDRPARNLYKTLLSKAYKTHPYRRQVIGNKEVVEGLTREDTLRFKGKWYRPNNMTLVLVGDIDSGEALRAIKEQFRGFRKGKIKRAERPIEPKQAEIRTAVLAKDVKETHLGIGFHIPGIKNDDTYAIDVAEIILGGGETSRLFKRLQIDEGVVHGVSAYAMSLKEPGVFFITGTLDTGKLDKALTGIMEEVKRLGTEGPLPNEIEKAKIQVESSFVYSRETMEGIASKLGYYQTLAGNIRYEKEYIESLRKVTADDVRRVVMEYLVPENSTVVVMLPEGEKDAATPEGIKAEVTNAYEKAGEGKTAVIENETVEDDEADITRVTLAGGITLLVKEVHSTPVVAMYAAFPGGLRFEDQGKNGIGAFTATLLARGTETMSRAQLARELEMMAGGVGGYSGWNSTGVSGKFLSRQLDRGLEIFADIIKRPVFPEHEVEKLKDETYAAIKRQEDNIPSYTFRLLYRTLYKDHPYGMPNIGTLETVKTFTRDDVVEHYRRFFVPGRMVLTVVGDVDTEHVIDRVNTLFSDFTHTAGKLPAPPVEKRQNEIRKTGEVKETAQTNIALAFLGASIGDEDSYTLKVIDQILSNQGGRLFIELRDRKSLAYSVSAFSKEGVDPGLFAVYIGCAPNKKDDAIKGLMEELERITKEKVSDEELKRAKNSIIGSYEIGLQSVSSQATNITYNELYGLGYDFSRHFPEKIDAVTSEDLLKAARKYITLEAYTISVVGPNGFEAERAGE